MQKFFGFNAALVALVLGTLLSISSPPASAATPNPPPSLCVGANPCVTTAASSPSSSGYKWHPGVYVFPGTVKCDSNAQWNDFATIDEIANVPQVTGIYIRWEWNCFEGDTAGDYAAAFARIDAYIAKLAPTGKKLMLSIWPMSWGECSASDILAGKPSFVPLPAYIKNTPGWVYYCNNARPYTVAMDKSGVIDRLIALSGALANRYDGNSTLVMWEPHEETAGLQGNPALGWTWDAALTQWRRLFAAMSTQWKKTMVRDSINWLKDNQSCASEVAATGRPGVAYGGADSIPEWIMKIQCNHVYRGLNYPDGTPNSSYTDYREKYPWVAEVQAGIIYGTTGTLADFQSYARDTMHARFIIWIKQSWDNNYVARYWTNTLPFLKSGGSTVYSTACPTGWTCTQ